MSARCQNRVIAEAGAAAIRGGRDASGRTRDLEPNATGGRTTRSCTPRTTAEHSGGDLIAAAIDEEDTERAEDAEVARSDLG